ncbi:MAG: acetyl-CoA carboxylase biotin carboxyl carrier protein subunit [Saprospiraceae bacterium]|nr:acetyl-CoA carboxylase biotin carboxyl carrier protein subunit [Saprospiraceae bacterium]
MKAIVNDVYEINLEEGSENKDVLLLPQGDRLIARIDGINYPMRIIDMDYSAKSYSIEINNRIYRVKLEDEMDQLIRKMGLKGKRSKIVSEIKTPMPGLVFKILKKAGDTVTAGETLLILEAMKMENAIKSPVDTVVKSVDVVEGQAVEKGAVLMTFVH